MKKSQISQAIATVSAGARMLSQSKFYMGYSRWSEQSGRYESWAEAVSRVMRMHRDKYAEVMTPELEALILEAEQAYSDQLVLGAQRALQFGGEQLRKHEARMYNCSTSHVDRVAFFQECMYLLLCGCGVGFSVQKHHIAKLPQLARRSAEDVKVFAVPDSIEGWADAFGVLMSSYAVDGGTFPEYRGKRVHFDFAQIRPKGAMISGGFKAPGPDGLRNALQKCEALLEGTLKGESPVSITSIVAYDFVMHMSDAVLAGGVRRSATICMFDKDDEQMLKAKTGNWFIDNPQRGRSNNSVVLKRDELTREQWANIMTAVRDFGEPGFVFVDDLDTMYNPCVEIGMRPICAITAESGFQFCNLTEINGGKCISREMLLRAARAAAILGTLQAGYTDFKYVSDATRRITEYEALIGVSITGWMNNPDVLFDEVLLKEAAELVRQVNREMAALIGVKPAARTTCAKPSGNASVLLGTASGIHGEHAPMYFRNVQINKEDEVAKLIMQRNPKMVEESVWSSNGTDIVVSFPVVSKEGSVYKRDLMGVKQLEYVKRAQQAWVENGTNVDLCVDKSLRHNISNTITVDDWAAVEQYIFDNRQWFAGISLLAAAGDKAYVQAPFTEVFTAEQILATYGDASMFASGLIVDGVTAFNGNLWAACATAESVAVKVGDTLMAVNLEEPVVAARVTSSIKDPLQRDWVRRFHKFASFFEGDVGQTMNCLKDSFNLHKWVSIQRALEDIDFSKQLGQQRYVEVDTLASQGCAGGACEVNFA